MKAVELLAPGLYQVAGVLRAASDGEGGFPAEAEFARRLGKVSEAPAPWLVARGDGGDLLGYAYAAPFRDRPADTRPSRLQRTRSRSPGHCLRLLMTPPGPARPSQTVPTGLSGVPPPGPAMPLTATA